ncbi:MAG: hypothetical protein GX587_06035 [Bacteroidales bacterium]|nr:hypothetical protein [Bacteroidales bacterium]
MENRLSFAILFFLILLGVGYFYRLENKAVVKIVLSQIPAQTPANDTIFISGDFNDWAPNNPDYSFTKDNNGTYSLSLKEIKPSSGFKITRGSWQTAETDTNCEQINNRTLHFTGDVTISLRIDNWVDLCNETDTIHNEAEQTPLEDKDSIIN